MARPAGARTKQRQVPQGPLPEDADAGVVALKSRSIPAAEAIAQSLAALQWLRAAGCQQYFFKYCSTFDSTREGNIGPVADALMTALDTDFTIACPAFPENGRTVYRGNLFVNDMLFNESGMQNHPLTPMRDPNLVRVLQKSKRAAVSACCATIRSRRGRSRSRPGFGSCAARRLKSPLLTPSAMMICGPSVPAVPTCPCSPVARGWGLDCRTTTVDRICCIIRVPRGTASGCSRRRAGHRR